MLKEFRKEHVRVCFADIYSNPSFHWSQVRGFHEGRRARHPLHEQDTSKMSAEKQDSPAKVASSLPDATSAKSRFLSSHEVFLMFAPADENVSCPLKL